MYGFEAMLQMMLASLQSQVNTINNSIAIVYNPPSSHSIVPGQTVIFSGSWGSSASSQTLIAMPPGDYRIRWYNCGIANNIGYNYVGINFANGGVSYTSATGTVPDPIGIMEGDGNIFFMRGIFPGGDNMIFKYLMGFNWSSLTVNNSTDGGTVSGNWTLTIHRFA